MAALDTIKESDIAYIKKLTNPPSAIKLVLEAVCVVLDVKPVKVCTVLSSGVECTVQMSVLDHHPSLQLSPWLAASTTLAPLSFEGTQRWTACRHIPTESCVAKDLKYVLCLLHWGEAVTC
jgi:hypothetical protein